MVHERIVCYLKIIVPYIHRFWFKPTEPPETSWNHLKKSTKILILFVVECVFCIEYQWVKANSSHLLVTRSQFPGALCRRLGFF